jgi:hypothetical protein
MDRLDALDAQRKTSPSTGTSTAAPSQTFKPLKYDAYDEITIMSQSSSTSFSKSFSALPPPSVAQDSRTRRQRRQKENEVRRDMQKSIARLTMDTEYDSQEEDHSKKTEEAVPF